MKKLFLCVLVMLAVFASFGFAQYGPHPGYYPPPRGDYPPPPPRPLPDHGRHGKDSSSLPSVYFSLSFPFPIQWENLGSGYSYESTLTAGFAVGMDLTAMFTKRLGLHLSADVYFPQIQAAFYEGEDGSIRDEILFIEDYWDSALGVSFFAGPTLALARTSRVLFAISPGIHVAAFLGDTSWGYSESRLMVGAGGSAEFAFNITKSLFIRAAVDVTYDFAGIDRYSVRGWGGNSYSDTEASRISILNIVPAIGVGFSF